MPPPEDLIADKAHDADDQAARGVLAAIGALLHEQNFEWTVQRVRYMTPEGIASLIRNPRPASRQSQPDRAASPAQERLFYDSTAPDRSSRAPVSVPVVTAPMTDIRDSGN
jgi:hypothetical protein